MLSSDRFKITCNTLIARLLVCFMPSTWPGVIFLGSAFECLEFLISLQKLTPRNFITVKLDSVLFLLP